MKTNMSSGERKASLDTFGITAMVLLCALWGFQQVAVKFAIDDVPPMWQAGIRSAVAALLVGAWLWLAQDRWTRGLFLAGMTAGALFALEFGLLYSALRYTDTARATLLLYTSPFVVAIGAHFFIRGERLPLSGWLGVTLAFVGTAVMMLTAATPEHADNNTHMWLGDILALGAGIAWGLTTLVVRMSGLSDAAPTQTLFYQLWVSGILLCLIAWIIEGDFAFPKTSLTWASLGFQIIVVATFSYLSWFVLMTRYAVTKLTVFGFLTPLFGSVYGVMFLDETIGTYHLIAVGLIVLGIVIVNLKGTKSTSKS